MNKWGKKFWIDLAERAGASAVGGALALFGAEGSGVVDFSQAAVLTLVGIPTATSLLKGLLKNLTGDEPSASLVGVTSSTEPAVPTDEDYIVFPDGENDHA